MENYISLNPNPVVHSYFKHFQTAQKNLNLYIMEQRMLKRKGKKRELQKSREH